MSRDIEAAALAIMHGKLVAFPTETVYGLGADATNEEAVKKIYNVKGRPSINPLIVHVHDLSRAQEIAEFDERALTLAENFWPGPLTIVVPIRSRSKIAKSVLAGLSTIAIRIPAHPVALALLKISGVPIAAPSANLSGYISATRSKHVLDAFADRDVFVLEDADECEYGIESTIVDLTSGRPTVLRYGFITPEAIGEVLGHEIQACSSLMQLKAPGMMDKHYSPKTKIRLNATSLQVGEIGLNFGDEALISQGSMNLSKDSDLIEAAANLYDMLRRLDDYAQKNNIETVAIAPIPNEGIGLAVNDRLQRAAF